MKTFPVRTSKDAKISRNTVDDDRTGIRRPDIRAADRAESGGECRQDRYADGQRLTGGRDKV